MLTVTQAAADALDTIVAATEGAPDTAGVRVMQTAEAADGAAIGLSVVAEPQPSDEVVAAGKAPVFVEPEIAELLSDKQLDATISGDQVGFVITEQP